MRCTREVIDFIDDDSDSDDDDDDDREDRGAVGHRTPQTEGDGHLPAQINITRKSR